MKSSLLRLCLLASLVLLASLLSAQAAKPELAIGPGDVRIDMSGDGGYLLVIRKKADIQSVILTESTADPSRKLDSYTLRSKEPNPVNGGEKRRLNGKFIESPGMYFLMSSTVVDDVEFGKAFTVFIPYVVVFGYPTARYGEINLLDGAYLNIRSFALPYADYGAAYRDNPYTIRLVQKASSNSSSAYNKEAVKTFTTLVQEGKGSLAYSRGEAALIADLGKLLAALPPGANDVALCLDSTKSMENDAPFLRKELTGLVSGFLAGHPGSRVAMVQFRDYMEEFLYKIAPFAPDTEALRAQLVDYYPADGRDVPEAVNEGVYACLTELDWQATRRTLILVGDAPPHPVPRGSVTPDMVAKRLAEQAIVLQALLLPD